MTDYVGVDYGKGLKKKLRKPMIDSNNNYCKFCGTSLTSDGARVFFEN